MPQFGEAPAEEHVYESQKTITIRNGKPDHRHVYVLNRAVVRFTNDDPFDYVITFSVQDEGVRPDVLLYLPGFESHTLIAGLGLKCGERQDCEYVVLAVSADSVGIDDLQTIDDHHEKFKVEMKTKGGGSGGGGTIHIGS